MSHSDQEFWDRVNAQYADLRNDPVAWAQELEERALWDATLADGLEKLEDPSTSS